MKKARATATVLVLIMTLVLSTTVYATDSNSEKIIQTDEIQENIESTEAEPSEDSINQDVEKRIDNEDVEAVEDLTSVENMVLHNATEKTEEEINEYALNFMRKSQQDNGIQIDIMDSLYDLDDNLTGYYITFEKQGDSAGYVLISFLHSGAPIVDLSFEGSYDNEDSRSYLEGSSKKIYLGEDIYKESLVGDGAFVSVLTEESIGKKELEEQYNNRLVELQNEVASSEAVTYGIEGGLIDWSNANLDANSIYKIPYFGAGGDYWIMKDLPNKGENNCTPTAATNVLWYFGWKYGSGANNNVADRVRHMPTNLSKANLLHDTLANGMNTTPANGTFFWMIPSGFTHFLGEPGPTWNCRYLVGFDEVYNTIMETCPIVMGVEFGNEGHAMFAIGRAKSNIGVRYVMIMDGWRRYGRFVRDGYYSKVSGYKTWVRI